MPSYDGRIQIHRQINDFLTFDEGLQAAKAIIDECLKEWTTESSNEIRTLINYSFEVDKKGRLNTSRILSLRRLKLTHPRWQEAMQALTDSLKVETSKSYIRLYRRNTDGEGYTHFSLNFSDV